MFNTVSPTMSFYHICLRGDAESERVDAAGGENSKVRRQSAAGGQSDLLLKDAAGRQHRHKAAVWSLELIEHLEGSSHIERTVSGFGNSAVSHQFVKTTDSPQCI